MFSVLALVSLSLAAAPAVTKQPVATPAKAPPKPAVKTVTRAAPAKAAPKAPAARTTPTTVRAATPYRAPAATARNRVQQPQYSRYSNTRRNAAARPRPVYHPVPTVPTTERTKEIQTALAQRGYLASEPSGAWDPDSTAAMKRFQHDQNLDADGKIGSLSLIALGLGPKRTVTASATPSTTSPVPPRP